MKSNYNYDFLLPFFTGEEEYRPSLKHIHKDSDGYIYATDAQIMIRIPADKVGNEYKAIDEFPKGGKLVSDDLNRPGNISSSIDVDDLIMVLSKAKWYKEKQGDDCPNCNGDGEVKCMECGYTHDCNECDGTGKINNRVSEFFLLQADDCFIVQIEQQRFKASYLHIIAISAKFAGVKTIEYVYDQTKPGYSALFKFDDIVILMLPFNSEDSDIELKTKICTNN